MKADAEKHQLRTTAAGEPDRARREGESWKREKTERILTGEMEELGKKTERSTIEAGRQGETGRRGRGRKALKYPFTLIVSISRFREKKRGEGEKPCKADRKRK